MIPAARAGAFGFHFYLLVFIFYLLSFIFSTTPSNSPLHRERAQRENCSHATMQRLLPLPKGRAMDAPKHRDAILPLCKGESEGVVLFILNSTF